MPDALARLIALALATSFAAVATPVRAQTPPDQAPPPDPQATATLPDDTNLGRIRAALSQGHTLRLDAAERRFYLQVVAPKRTISDWLAGKDLRFGAVPNAVMTHADYVQMITPKEMYSAGGIRPQEVIEFALTSVLIDWVVRNGAEKWSAARSERERRRIEEQINLELAVIEQANRKNKDKDKNKR
jgi:hypothetical protein